MRINNNVAAYNTYRNLSTNEANQQKSLERLSSGLRINRAADDASGLVTSESLRSQIGGLTVATKNAQDGISVVQTAEGGLNEVTTMLQRMRDLAMHAGGDGAADSTSQAADNAEFQSLSAEIDRIAGNTNFGGQNLLSGGFKGSFTVGSDAASGNIITVNIQSDATVASAGTSGFSTSDLGLSGLSLSGTTGAQAALSAIDTAIKTVSSARGLLGATQNRFEHAIANLQVTTENLTASESRIRDTDMAKEMTNFTKNQVLTQASQAMLAQANSAPQQVLQLLRG
jgi:flagellin